MDMETDGGTEHPPIIKDANEDEEKGAEKHMQLSKPMDAQQETDDGTEQPPIIKDTEMENEDEEKGADNDLQVTKPTDAQQDKDNGTEQPALCEDDGMGSEDHKGMDAHSLPSNESSLVQEVKEPDRRDAETTLGSNTQREAFTQEVQAETVDNQEVNEANQSATENNQGVFENHEEFAAVGKSTEAQKIDDVSLEENKTRKNEEESPGKQSEFKGNNSMMPNVSEEFKEKSNNPMQKSSPIVGAVRRTEKQPREQPKKTKTKMQTKKGKRTLSPWFMNQLKTLGLDKFYPGKLKQKDLIKIFPSDVDENEPCPKGLGFLQKLLHVNRHSRNTFESDSIEINEEFDSDDDDDDDECCSYSTAIMIIFLCADPFLRRYLVQKMHMCQFAVPFILPTSNEVLLWPQRIVRNWKTKSRAINESCIASEAMPMMTAMQVGNFESCISAEFFNLAFNEPGYEGFSNVMNEGENRVSDGMVEVAWFLPRGRGTDAFPDALIAAHLRGNADEHYHQAQYLIEVSEAVVLITDSLEKIDEILIEDIDPEKVVIALKSSKAKKLRPFKHHSFQVVPFTQLEGCIRSIRAKLNQILVGSANSLEDRTKKAEDFGFLIDESEALCIRGKEHAKEVISYLENMDVFQARKKVLVFQEEWKEWTRIDKEQTRRKNFSNVSEAKAYIEKCELKKQAIEKKLQWKSLSQCFKMFLKHLKEQNERQRSFFIEWLQFYLNERSRLVAHTLQSELDDHYQDSKKLSEIGEQLANSSLGIEHFFREVAMVWTIINKKTFKGVEHLRWLPWTVASLLLEGYPLEILNGDASYVPYKWIKEVFHFIDEMLGREVQVFVTSILGVQSSGKSTFLNAMFGINFAVSSGRCTKGAFIQLVEVDQKIQRRLGCDYLVVIDTEGLKSAEHISYDSKHDNELGTLAVGVADLSVMNIGGENDDSMKDVLQIVCFALLRMTIAWEKRPKCMMVHQNVADLAAAHNTTAGKLRFFQTLDEMTKLAAELENCSHKYERFKDVIDYDTKKMDIYIPGLWQGSPPMASVNIDYSDASQKTKGLLINEITNTNTLEVFITRIKDVFKAVKQENFIFSFQNTVAAKAHQNLAQIYNNEKWNRKTEILNWFTNVEVKLKETGNYSEKEKRNVIKEAESIVLVYISKLEDVVNNYFEEHQEVAGMLERSRSIFEQDIKSRKRKAHEETIRKVEELFLNFRNEEKVQKVAASGEQHFKPRLLQLKRKYGEAKYKLTEEQKETLETDFQDEWTAFLNGIECPQMNEEQNIENVMYASLLEKVEVHDKHLQGNSDVSLKYVVTDKDIELNRSSNTKKAIHSVVNVVTAGAIEGIWRDPKKHALHIAQLQANEILESCKNFIRNQTKGFEMFREEKCYDLITYAHELIKVAKGDTFSFKPYFRVRILEVICYYATAEFVAMRDRYKEAQDPRKKLEMSKEKYFNLLLSLVEAENHVKVFCSEVESGILSGIKRHFNVALRDHIATKKLELCNRKQVQLAILVQLNEAASFERYEEYLRDFKGFCSSWLRNEVEVFLNHGTEDGHTWFVKIMLKMAEDVLNKFATVIDEHEQEQEYQPFLTALQNSTRDADIHVGLDAECVGRLSILPVKELPKFIQDVKQYMNEEAINAIKDKLEELDAKEELDQIDPSIEEQLYEALMCKDGEQCPFCKAPCDVIGVHDEHKADIHQPQGFSGCIVRKTTTLDTEECPVSISLNNSFSDNKTNYRLVSYKNYRQYYPTWSIPAEANPATSKYWKMVLMKFNKEFAKSSGTNPITIPESWKGYDWPVVRKELEELYEQNIPE